MRSLPHLVSLVRQRVAMLLSSSPVVRLRSRLSTRRSAGRAALYAAAAAVAGALSAWAVTAALPHHLGQHSALCLRIRKLYLSMGQCWDAATHGGSNKSLQMLILPGLPMTPSPTQAPFESLPNSVETGAERQLAVHDAGWRRSAVLGACVGVAHWLLTTARYVVPVLFFAVVLSKSSTQTQCWSNVRKCC